MWHDGLLFKLNQNGIFGSLLKLFENYLHNRKQRVVLNGSYSDYSAIESGVPPGSVLGPFLVYINDLERNIKSNIKFFADDMMLFSIVKDPVTSANDLNHDLDMIYQWAHQWKMEFNPDPIKQATEVLFSCEKNSVNHPQLNFNGSAVLSEKVCVCVCVCVCVVWCGVVWYVWCGVCGVWCVVCGLWFVVCGLWFVVLWWCGVVWCGVVWCGVVCAKL